MRALNREIGRVAFYDSIAVIDKLPEAKEQPYRRMFSGADAPLWNPAIGFVPNAAGVLLSASTARQLAEFVLAQIAALNQSLAERDGRWSASTRPWPSGTGRSRASRRPSPSGTPRLPLCIPRLHGA
ncbi:MAG: hypothetical protein ACREYC_10585 [Gammaproteobacteria bacterium]